ncbi:hypothetical protein NLI96_g9151 [Meripilus lineatus]|uniref:Uncharacterized protein n=1 Tax=Meripilus lineatus TaxID=2056292 RepID=A0AAD5UXR0_9APHY|nr:hypothetical protein NLI96_g9151 [Physisporinus lineatus]
MKSSLSIINLKGASTVARHTSATDHELAHDTHFRQTFNTITARVLAFICVSSWGNIGTFDPSIDIDNQVQIEFLGKIVEGFYWQYDARLFSAITRHPIKETPILVHYVRGSTGLLRLPPELILEIIRSINRFIDALALVMTNKMLYSLGFGLIQRRMVKISAPCIGSRILCLGSGIGWGRNDLPPGMTAKDWEDVMEDADEDDENKCSYYEFFEETFNELKEGRRIPFYSDILEEWMGKGIRYARNETKSWDEALYAILGLGDATKGGLGDDALVLCNLTKRVYVDGGKAWELVKTSSLRRDDGIPCLLEFILRSHICWSSHPGVEFELSYKEELHRGAWAVDRFEITTRDKFEAIKPIPGGVQDNWKDVTEQAMELTNHFAIAFDSESYH